MKKWCLPLSICFSVNAAAYAFVAPIGRASKLSISGRVQSKQSTYLPPTASSATQLNASRSLAVAGRIPWGKMVMTEKKMEKLVSIVRSETHLFDILLMTVFSIFSVPIGRFLYQRFFYRFRNNVKFEDSITYHVQELLSEAARIGLVCYLFDVIEILFEVMGFKWEQDVSKAMAKLMYSTWIALKVRRYRIGSFAFDRAIKNKRNKKNVVSILNKVSDFFTFGVLGMVWIDILKIKRGAGLSSIFALSGAGTLTLSLALQDLVKKSLGGLALSTSEKFAIGDNIVLGDGTQGTVKKIGWLNTDIKGGDELITSIPNSQLTDLRVTNRSNQKYSQVKQTLRFDYSDVDRIPALLTCIKDEIKETCPTVITDGSHPFRVYWTSFEADHLEISVDCRLKSPPVGDLFSDARQNILIAIARAVKKMQINFAMPTGTYKDFVGYEEQMAEKAKQQEDSDAD